MFNEYNELNGFPRWKNEVINAIIIEAKIINRRRFKVSAGSEGIYLFNERVFITAKITKDPTAS